jgi:hypothetical protein
MLGCDDDDPISTAVQNSTNLIAIHAVADAPSTQLVVNDAVVQDNLNFATTTEIFDLPAGKLTVSVDANLPNNETARVVDSLDLELTKDTFSTVIVAGSVADNNLTPLLVTRELNPQALTSGDPNDALVQTIHAAINAPAVDLYVTAPGSTLQDSSPIDTLAFGDDTGVVGPLTAGEYQIRLTLQGTDTVAFDSGSFDLPAGIWTIAAIPNVGGISPVQLLAFNDETSLTISDTAEQASVKVTHAVVDAPAVDISLNGDVVNSGLEYPLTFGYAAIAGGEYALQVATTAAPNTIVIDVPEVTFNANNAYSAFAVGTLANSDIEPLVVLDSRRPIATSAVINVIHAASTAPAVDVYVTESSDISDSSPAILNLSYKEDTQNKSGDIYLAAGDYFVTVTIAGTKQIAIDAVPVSISSNNVYQAVAINAPGASFNLLLNNLTP